MIRAATLDDSEWIIDVAKEVCDPFDIDGTRTWFQMLAQACNPDVLFIRGDFGALIATCQRTFFSPDQPTVHLVFAVSRPNRGFEGFRMMEVMVQWGRSLGASVHFGSQCGLDMEPIAKRLGAVMDEPSWVVKP